MTIQHNTISSLESTPWKQAAGSIVIVEDALIRRLIHNLLGRFGYNVVEAPLHGAVDLIKRTAGLVSLLITNSPQHFLPFANDVSVLYLAACPDYDLAAKFRSCHVLSKPFHPEELIEAVRDLIGSR
jgi:CheY-like chemotaxis protein